MIQTAYIDSAGWLQVRLDNGNERAIEHGVQLQGFTAEGVTYKDQAGWLKIWHKNGNVETITHVG